MRRVMVVVYPSRIQSGSVAETVVRRIVSDWSQCSDNGGFLSGVATTPSCGGCDSMSECGRVGEARTQQIDGKDSIMRFLESI